MRRSTRRSSVALGAEDSRDATSVQVGNFSTRFSLPSFVKRVEKLTDDQRSAVKEMGFGNLLLMQNQMLNKNLLVELMERWSCQERAFLLLPGAITITLMDVVLILGLRVIGNPVLLRGDEPFSDLEMDYGAASSKRKITVASIESRLDSIGGAVNDDFMRSFLLFTIGTVLFPSTNGKVDSRYLSLLKNVEDVCHFAWGAAILEDIFMWLNKRKETNVQYVGGCLIFLQIWSYEHIDIARPSLMNCSLTLPRLCRWENSRSHHRQWFIAKFNELQDHQIMWELQPDLTELEFDVIKEFLESQCARNKVARLCCSSDSCSIVSIIEVESNSDVTTADEVDMYLREDGNSEQLMALKCVPELQTGTMQHLSKPTVSELNKHVELAPQCKHSSPDITNGSGDGSKRKIQLLEQQNVELKQEIDELKSEIRMLRNQMMSISILEEQKIELRRQVDDLRRENQFLNSSTNNFVARLETLLQDEGVDATGET